MAHTIRLLVFLLPAVAAFSVVAVLSHYAPPHELGIPRWLWYLAALPLSVLVTVGVERTTRHLLPLAALFRLTLVFPDKAPSRFGLAMRTGTTRRLQRRIDEIRASGIKDDDTSHAEKMLELVAALSVHDRLTRGHCERVRAYTDMVIDELDLHPEDAARLHWAALLHDVGKIMVPQEILTKIGRPSDDEWEVLKSHTWQGDRLIEPIKPWLGEWAAAVGSHHERWDGGGYPMGLAGREIHIGARIVAVVDAFDVMTSHRSYKKPMPAAEARAEIARCGGTQFDPDVVRAFLNISLGRLQLAAGPLSWAASASLLSRAVPFLPAAASSVAAAAAITAGTFGLHPSMNSNERIDGDEFLALELSEDATAVDDPTLGALPDVTDPTGLADPGGATPTVTIPGAPGDDLLDEIGISTSTTSILPGDSDDPGVTLPPTPTSLVDPTLGDGIDGLVTGVTGIIDDLPVDDILAELPVTVTVPPVVEAVVQGVVGTEGPVQTILDLTNGLLGATTTTTPGPTSTTTAAPPPTCLPLLGCN